MVAVLGQKVDGVLLGQRASLAPLASSNSWPRPVTIAPPTPINASALQLRMALTLAQTHACIAHLPTGGYYYVLDNKPKQYVVDGHWNVLLVGMAVLKDARNATVHGWCLQCSAGSWGGGGFHCLKANENAARAVRGLGPTPGYPPLQVPPSLPP